MKLVVVMAAALVAFLARIDRADAWGDEGHEIVGLIADHFLAGPTRMQVQRLLATDHSGLVADQGIATEATWADKYRDSDRDTTRQRYEHTHLWHFVDLGLRAPDVATACFDRPPLRGAPASQGPANDCVIDKINEFSAELSSSRTAPAERLLALQFLLHFVGDVHQPLHASDDDDEGGNEKRVTLLPGGRGSSLHQVWDTQFVRAIDADPARAANELLTEIRSSDLASWRRGEAVDWAREAFALARRDAYGDLPAPFGRGRGRYRLTPAYVQAAEADARLQLKRAGVRLAMLLNRLLR